MTGILAAGSAVWLGILTSISPCPLASNIAAVSLLGRRAGHTRHVLAAGLLYTLGRTTAYVALAAAVTAGLAASGTVSRFLQRYLNQALGPILIVVGMVLLDLIQASASLNLAGERLQDRASRGGLVWALVVGVVFALSFCPVSAGLFFGGLVPLSAAHGSRLLLPGLYGVGTAAPVVAFSLLMAFAAQHVGRAFQRLMQVEFWVRTATGTVFILVGIYYCLTHIYGLSLLGG